MGRAESGGRRATIGRLSENFKPQTSNLKAIKRKLQTSNLKPQTLS